MQVCKDLVDDVIFLYRVPKKMNSVKIICTDRTTSQNLSENIFVSVKATIDLFEIWRLLISIN